jgi:PAS domain S-box-containing protein
MDPLFSYGHHTFESDFKTKDGILVPCEIAAHMFRWQGKNVVLSVARDISELRKNIQDLENSRVKFSTLFESNMDALFIHEIQYPDHPGRIIEVNEYACSLFGYSSEEMLTLSPAELMIKKDWELLIPELGKKLIRDRHVAYEAELVCKNGSTFPAEISAHLFELEGRKVVLAICRDISRRKEAEKNILKSERFNRSLLDNAPYPILVISPEGAVDYVNRAMETFTGFPSPELIGTKTPYPWWHPEQIEKTRQYFQRAFEEGIERVECKFRRKDGTDIWAAIVAYPVHENGHIHYVISNLVDITYRKGAEKKLDLYRKKLQELASELDITEERERRNMAEKIHDSIGQTLALMKIKAAMLEDVLEKGKGSDLAGQIVEGLDEVISFTRDFLFEISPPILYELGFEAAVRWLGDKMLADHGLVLEYEDDGLFKPMIEDKKAFLFRSLKELLMNVIKHSQVKEVFIRSYLDGDQIILEVEDRGTGFDVEKMYKNLGSSSSYGLFSIRERVNFLGGKMEIYSRENTGTLVSISLPVDENMSGGERHIH